MGDAARGIFNGKLALAAVASHKREVYLEEYQTPRRDPGLTKAAEFHVEDRTEAASSGILATLGGLEALHASRATGCP